MALDEWMNLNVSVKFKSGKQEFALWNLRPDVSNNNTLFLERLPLRQCCIFHSATNAKPAPLAALLVDTEPDDIF